MIKIITKEGEELVAYKMQLDVIGDNLWIWCFGADGNFMKKNKGQDVVREYPESFIINGVKYTKTEKE